MKVIHLHQDEKEIIQLAVENNRQCATQDLFAVRSQDVKCVPTVH